MLAVALDKSVYLWSASSGDILQLLQMEEPGDYTSSVVWMKEGSYPAVCTSSAEVQLWDVQQQKRLRNMTILPQWAPSVGIAISCVVAHALATSHTMMFG